MAARVVIATRGMCPGEWCIKVGTRAPWHKDDAHLMFVQVAYVMTPQIERTLKRMCKKYKMDACTAIIDEQTAIALHGYVKPDES